MGLFDLFKKDADGRQEHADYSLIDSNEKAQQLVAQQQLVKLYLMPLEFGGEDSLMNILYVPEAATKQKELFDAKIEGFLIDGLRLNYVASPEYKGKSFIPSVITIQVKGDRQLTETITIW